MKLARLGIAAVAMFAMTGAVSAATLTLTGPIQGNSVGPQSSSNPCIIAGQNCGNPANFGYNNFTPNNASSLNRYSTSLGGSNGVNVADGVQGTPYTASQITSIVGNTFLVAIDVNTTGAHSEVLNLFEVIINNAVAYSYTGPTPIGNVANNGNGFADWTLGTIDLTGLSPNATVLFHAQWSGAVDGAESFFIVSTSAVPEPATWGMMLLGFVGLAFAFRQSRRKVSFA